MYLIRIPRAKRGLVQDSADPDSYEGADERGTNNTVGLRASGNVSNQTLGSVLPLTEENAVFKPSVITPEQ